MWMHAGGFYLVSFDLAAWVPGHTALVHGGSNLRAVHNDVRGPRGLGRKLEPARPHASMHATCPSSCKHALAL